MAFPRTLTGASLPSIYNARPFRASNGNHYAVVLTSTLKLGMFKADNGDNAWSEMDSANAPTVAVGDPFNCIAAVMSGTTIHIATSSDDTGSSDFHYSTFNTSTDVWVVKSEVITTGLGTNVSLASRIGCDLAVRSDGTVVCVYQVASASIMGTTYTRVGYKIRSSGGTWGSVVAIDDAGSVSYQLPRCVLGASDKVHISYIDVTNTNCVHKSLTSGGSLSSAENLNDTAVTTSVSFGLSYHDESGSEIIYGAWCKSSGLDVYTAKITSDGTPAAEALASDSAFQVSASNAASIVVNDATNTPYLLWTDIATTQDVYLSSDTGSGWGNHTELLDAVSVTSLGANIYVIDNGDTVLAYTYLDGSTVKYNEYVVAAAGTTVAPSAAIATALGSVGTIILGSVSATPASAVTTSVASVGNVIQSSLSLTPSNALVLVSASISNVVEGSLSLTPSTAISTGLATIGGVIQVSLMITPSSATAIATASIGDVVITTPTITPDAAIATSDASIGAVIQGSVSITPASADTIGTASLGAIVQDSMTVVPASADVTALASIEATVQGSLTLTPSNADSLSSASIGAIIEGSLSITPDAAIGAALIGNADVIYGSLTLAPDAAISISDASIGNVDTGGNLTLAPNGAVATGIASIGDVVLGNTSLVPESADGLASASIGNVVYGDVSVVPASADGLAVASIADVIQSSMVVEPSAASVNVSAAILDVVLGSIVITPTMSTAVASASVGDIVQGSVFVTPANADALATATIGNIDAGGNLSITPSAALATSFSSIGEIIQSSLVLVPADAEAIGLATIGDVITSSISLTPTSADGVSIATIGNIVAGSIVLIPTSAIVTSTASIGAVLISSNTITPPAASAIGAASIGDVGMSSIGIAPTSANVISLASISDVLIATPIVHYVGELERYRLYDGVFADDWSLYEGEFTGNFKLYQGEFDEDYALYAGEIPTYKRYIGTLVILDEEGNMIEKIILGQTYSPKFTLTAGADHGGTFAEPDTVTIKVKWGDDTEETYSTDDVDNPVVLDSENEGVYYATLVPAVEGTAKIYALAEWESPVWAVAKNKRVEVVGIYETQ